MNRAQLRAKAERRRMRDELKREYPNSPLYAGYHYDRWLMEKGWLHHDPKKVLKRSPWIKTHRDVMKLLRRKYDQESTFKYAGSEVPQ
jgi:hypothetical protein